MFRELGVRSSEVQALQSAGEAMNALGHTKQARALYRQALTVVRKIGNRHLEGRSYDGLAHTYRADGDLDGAARYWERALALYADLGVPEKTQVRAELDKLAAHAPHRAPRNYP